MGRQFHIRERERVADDAAPAGCAKLNDRHGAHYSGHRRGVHSNAAASLAVNPQICFHDSSGADGDSDV